jgi:hypothetical protein
VKLWNFGLKTAKDRTCPVTTGLVWYNTILFLKFRNFYNPCSFLSILLLLMLIFFISISWMDPHREKRSKKGQDIVRPSSKRGHQGKVVVIHSPPPPRPHHHPSHSSEEEDDDRELVKIHLPMERTNRMPHKYSKKTKQENINQNHGDPMYDGSQQSTDLRFWSHFHVDWYRSIYLYVKKPMVETKWVNWEWMAILGVTLSSAKSKPHVIS